MPYQVSMMGWVGSGEDFCGLGGSRNFGLGFEKVTHDQLCCRHFYTFLNIRRYGILRYFPTSIIQWSVEFSQLWRAGLCSPLGHSFSRMMSDLRQEQRQQYVMMIFMNTLWWMFDWSKIGYDSKTWKKTR